MRNLKKKPIGKEPARLPIEKLRGRPILYVRVRPCPDMPIAGLKVCENRDYPGLVGPEQLPDEGTDLECLEITRNNLRSVGHDVTFQRPKPIV